LKRFLSFVWLFLAAAPACPQEESPEENSLRTVHEKLLRTHKLPTSGPALLDFFADRTPSPERIERVKAIIVRLGAPAYDTRVDADAQLNKLAKLARPILREAVRDGRLPLETRRRLELVLKNNPEDMEPALAEATAFLIARQKPAGAARTLLAYLPFATNPQVIAAVRESLPQVALTEGEPHPALKAALTDANPLVRGIAGEALIRAGGVRFKPLVKKLLDDEHKSVRWHLLGALVEARDRDAVPLTINLLGEIGKERAWEVEDLLCRVAGEKGPGVYLSEADSAAAIERAWRDWWTKNADEVDLAKLTSEPPFLGNTLVTQMVPGKGLVGKVLEVGPDNEKLWEIEGLRYPVDARIIGPNRVLVAEYFSRKVTERDFKGNILWEKAIDMPIHCQRLPNGHTFIGSRRQLLLVDRDGKELFQHFAATTSICAAYRFRNGQMLMVNSAGILTHLDQGGREIRTFKVGQVYAMGGNIDVLPGGRILVPAYRENRVVEYNLEGKELWSASVRQPVSATRLPGGNVLVVSMGQLRILELDRGGEEVWTLDVEGRPWRARKR